MITVPLINWQPMSMMPESRKDGRFVLLWADGTPEVGSWNNSSVWDTDGWWEAQYEGANITNVSWWADINPPE